MATKKYTDENGLLYFWQRIKTIFALQSNTYTKTEVDDMVAQAGEDNVIEVVKVNGTALTPDVNKAVDVTVPTNNNQLTNGAGYQTATNVDAIDDALADITGIDFQVVASLPATGVKGVIYLVSNSGSSPNIYDEYIWLSSSSSFEKIGTTDIDLSGYQLSSELVAISNAEIDTIVAS